MYKYTLEKTGPTLENCLPHPTHNSPQPFASIFLLRIVIVACKFVLLLPLKEFTHNILKENKQRSINSQCQYIVVCHKVRSLFTTTL